MVVHLDHPDRETERELLLGTGGIDALAKLSAVATPTGLASAIAAVRQVHCSPAVADYLIDLVGVTRIIIPRSQRARQPRTAEIRRFWPRSAGVVSSVEQPW